MKWVKDPDADNFDQKAAHDGRFHLVTWKFGTIHQAKILIEYDHAWCCHRLEGREGPIKSVGISLEAGRTVREAKQRMVEWLKNYQKHGPDTPDVVIERCFKDYPSLYERRCDVIESLWFDGPGNGYVWLDGAIVYTDQSPPEDFSHMEEAVDRAEQCEREMWERIQKLDLPEDELEKLRESLEAPEPEKPKERPLPDDGRPLNIQLRERNARLLCLPSDLRPEWRLFGIEAATLLRDRAIDPATQRVGTRALEQLG